MTGFVVVVVVFYFARVCFYFYNLLFTIITSKKLKLPNVDMQCLYNKTAKSISSLLIHILCIYTNAFWYWSLTKFMLVRIGLLWSCMTGRKLSAMNAWGYVMSHSFKLRNASNCKNVKSHAVTSTKQYSTCMP